MGSVSPHTTMVDGSAQDVANEVKKLAVRQARDGGFVVMPGVTSTGTSRGQRSRPHHTARSITYPIDIEALGGSLQVQLPGHPRHRASRRRPDVDGSTDATTGAADGQRAPTAGPQTGIPICARSAWLCGPGTAGVWPC
jgi:hypothetical protein